MVDIVQADGDELGNAGDGSAETGIAGYGRQGGGVDRGQFLQRLRRIGGPVEVLHMGRQVAELAGFIDQAGLFRTLGPVTNKLHFWHSLVGFVAWQVYWSSAGRIAMAALCCIAGQGLYSATNLKASPSLLMWPPLK